MPQESILDGGSAGSQEAGIPVRIPGEVVTNSADAEQNPEEPGALPTQDGAPKAEKVGVGGLTDAEMEAVMRRGLTGG